MQTRLSHMGVWIPSPMQRMSAAAVQGGPTATLEPWLPRWSAAMKTCATTEASMTWHTPGNLQVWGRSAVTGYQNVEASVKVKSKNSVLLMTGPTVLEVMIPPQETKYFLLSPPKTVCCFAVYGHRAHHCSPFIFTSSSRHFHLTVNLLQLSAWKSAISSFT